MSPLVSFSNVFTGNHQQSSDRKLLIMYHLINDAALMLSQETKKNKYMAFMAIQRDNYAQIFSWAIIVGEATHSRPSFTTYT